MGGVCERPGCSSVAAAAVAADPRRSIVWIGDLDGSGARVNRLCAVHADTLAAPLGWERRDVREAPRLFAVPSVTPEPTPPRPTRRRRSATPSPAAAVTTAAPLVTAAAPAPAVEAFGGELPPAHLGELHRGDAQLSAGATALLDVGVDTPLLARAFRTARAAG